MDVRNTPWAIAPVMNVRNTQGGDRLPFTEHRCTGRSLQCTPRRDPAPELARASTRRQGCAQKYLVSDKGDLEEIRFAARLPTIKLYRLVLMGGLYLCSELKMAIAFPCVIAFPLLLTLAEGDRLP